MWTVSTAAYFPPSAHLLFIAVEMMFRNEPFTRRRRIHLAQAPGLQLPSFPKNGKSLHVLGHGLNLSRSWA